MVMCLVTQNLWKVADSRPTTKYWLTFLSVWIAIARAKDPYNRFRFGIPPEKNKADFAFIQHMFTSLNKKGQAAIICSQGILFRGNEEVKIREGMIKEDAIEGIVV